MYVHIQCMPIQVWVSGSPGPWGGGPGSTEYSVPGDIEKGVDKGGGGGLGGLKLKPPI